MSKLNSFQISSVISNKYFLCIPRYIAASLFALITISSVAFLIWAADRGLDISDEGIYLLASQFPEEVKIAPSAFYLYTAWVYKIGGHNVIVLRLFGLLLMVGSSSFLFYGLHRLLKQIGWTFPSDLDVLITEWSIIIFGAISYYALMLSTPNYNLINSAMLNTASGSLFLGLSLLDMNGKKYSLPIIAFIGAGLCIAIVFFVKFTAGMALFCIFSLILAVWPNDCLLTKIRNIISIGIGILIWIALHFGLVQSPISWWQILYRGIENGLMVSSSYGWASLQRYYVECSDLLIDVFLSFWIFYAAAICGLIILVLLRNLGKLKQYFLPLLILIFFTASALKSYSLNYHMGGTQHLMTLRYFYVAWFFILVFALVISLLYNWKTVSRSRSCAWGQLLLTGIVLLFLPFAGLIGTGNDITAIIFFYIAPWFGLFVLLLIVLSSLLDTRWILNCGACIIIMFVFVQVIYYGSIFPYRLNTGILGQNVYTNIGQPPTRLKLDPATSEFFNKISIAAHDNGFQPGDDILAFCNMAGVVFSLGGKSPYNTHYTSAYIGSRKTNEMVLSSIPRDRIKKAYILQNALGADGFPDLARFGISFPSNYIMCGEAIWPYNKDRVRLWKPK